MLVVGIFTKTSTAPYLRYALLVKPHDPSPLIRSTTPPPRCAGALNVIPYSLRIRYTSIPYLSTPSGLLQNEITSPLTMRCSHHTVNLLLFAPFLLTTIIAVKPSDFQPMDHLPTAHCTALWNDDFLGCLTSDFSNGSPCSPGCVFGVETTQDEAMVVCKNVQADPNSLMGLFMAGKGTDALCPNAGGSQTPISTITTTTQSSGGASGGASTSAVSSGAGTMVVSSSSSIPTSSSQPSSVAPSTITSTIITTQASSPSSSVSSSSDPLTTTIVLHSTFVTHLTAPLSSSPSPTFTSSTSSTSSTPKPSETSTAAGFLHTAVNDGSATVLTSKPAQTSSTNPDAFGGGGSPFEIASAGIRSISNLQRWPAAFVLGGMLCMAWWWWIGCCAAACCSICCMLRLADFYYTLTYDTIRWDVLCFAFLRTRIVHFACIISPFASPFPAL